jgi:Protein of unknown function (DUF2892)
MSFAKFMAQPVGRAIRVIAGVVLISVGLSMSSTVGYIVAALGAVAFLAGALNVCLIAPLLKAPFSGKRLTARR